MSILTCVVKPEHAWVCVDTAAPGIDGKPSRRFPKLIPLVHANAVLAGRGNGLFLTGAFNVLAHEGVANVDEMIDRMPAFLAVLCAELRHRAAIIPPKEGEGGRQELVLIGWSKRLDRPIARAFVGDMLAGTFEQLEANPFIVAPPTWDAPESAPPLETLADLMNVARAQVARLRRDCPGMAAGGDLIVARIERDRMTISTECAL